MIQRIQTLWLLLSTLCAALVWIIPVYGGSGADQVIREFSIRENLLMMFLVTLSAIIPFITIFFFRNRSIQKKLLIVNLLLALAVIAAEYFAANAFKKEFGIIQGNWQLSAILPFFIILFCIFAYRGILHDEKLLSAADRLR